MDSTSIRPIVLAAGRGARMGITKALAKLEEQSFLERIAATCSQLPTARPVVVVGAEASRVVEAHAGLEVRWVHNPDWASTHMIDSLRLGLASVEAAAYLVWPVDCPLVTLQAVHALCSFPCRQAAVPYYLGRAGHPVLLPGTARTAIEACASLREHLSLASSLQRVEVNDAGVLSNLNSLADNADA